MNYTISGLDAGQFVHLYGQDEDYLTLQGALRVKVESCPGYPDRISLRDIPVGETAILINHIYQPANTPYHGSHAIYLWEGYTEQGIYLNNIPEVMSHRLLSLRAYDENHLMVKAETCQGDAAEQWLNHFFDDSAVSYIHFHYAKRGCFACLAERVL